MKRNFWFYIIAILMLVMSSSAHAQTTALANILNARIGEKPDYTRFVLDVASIKKYNVFTLQNPPRVVIDLTGATISNSAKSRVQGLNSKNIRSVRYGGPKPGTLRIVLDMTNSSIIKEAFVLAPTKDYKYNRLVVDIGSIDSRIAKKTQPSAPINTTKPQPSVSKPPVQKGGLPIPKSMLKKPAPTAPITSRGLSPSLAPKPVLREVVKSPVTITPKAVRDRKIVVIDAGHGGIDPGAIGKSGIYEKTITLKYAKDLRNALEKSGYKVVLTRTKDYFVNLRDRVDVARKAKGDLFISLHADSHPNPRTQGLSVYTLSEKRAEKEVAALARKADKEEVIEGVDLRQENSDLQELLIDMVQRDTKNTSARFAEILVKNLGGKARLLRNTHRFAGFVVLTGADVPSVLLELGYLSNRSEEKLLRTDRYRNKLVTAIKKAIDVYFKEQG